MAKVNFDTIFDILAKILCLLVLTGQAIALDSYFFKLDYSGASPYLWVVLDVLVVLSWTISLLVPICLKKSWTTDGHWIKSVLIELRYAYLAWIFYAVVLCFKLNHMFFFIAEYMTPEPSLYSSTALKLLISLAGVAFLLLVYSHHRDIKEDNYRQIMEKISLSACLDILDCLSLLNFLFVNVNRLVLPYRVDRVIRAFSSICILLPVFPLLVLRVLQHPTTSLKWYKLSIMTQTALYFLLVNLPLFSIRLHFWITHNADISTFFTKNVIMLFKGASDIVSNSYHWLKDIQNESSEFGAEMKGPEQHMLEETAMGDEPVPSENVSNF